MVCNSKAQHHNPTTLDLALNNYFDDPCFLNYLQHLAYWKKPKFIVHLRYPLCLQVLDCLQSPSFRVRLSDAAFVEHLDRQLQESFSCLSLIAKLNPI